MILARTTIFLNEQAFNFVFIIIDFGWEARFDISHDGEVSLPSTGIQLETTKK